MHGFAVGEDSVCLVASPTWVSEWLPGLEVDLADISLNEGVTPRDAQGALGDSRASGPILRMRRVLMARSVTDDAVSYIPRGETWGN